MDESDGLENRYGGNLIVGSNPTPSASYRRDKAPDFIQVVWAFFLQCPRIGYELFLGRVFQVCDYPPIREPYPGGLL